MKSRWLIATALMLAKPATAATDLQAMDGVWQGTIGTLPVRACYDAGEYRSEGRYFYVRNLTTIPLIADRDKPGELTEGWADDKDVARWTIDGISGHTLAGTWRGKKRTLPIRLRRIAFTTDEVFDRACSSLAFVEPIVAAARIVRRTERLNAVLTAEQWTLAYPDDSVSVESFQLPGTGAAIDAINRRLREPFENSEEGWAWCLRNTGSFGADYHYSIEPTLATARWLAVKASNDSFCGGAHPNTSNVATLFDRTSGAIVNLFDWFAPAAVRRTTYEEGTTVDTLGPKLLRHVAGKIPFAERREEDCRPSVESATTWDLALTEKGIAFTPNLPRVMMACGDTVVLSWAELSPYLNAAGKREVAALRAESTKR